MARKHFHQLLYFSSLFFALVLFTNSYAQEPDSIIRFKEKLDKVFGVERMKVLLPLAEYYQINNSQLALSYAAQYLKLAELNNSIIDQAQAHFLLSNLYKYQVEWRRSLESSLNALEKYSLLGDSLKMAKIYSRIGDSYIFLRQFDSAVEYIDKGLKYFESKGNISRIIISEIQLGKAYCISEQNEKAIQILSETVDLATKNELNDHSGWSYYWLGFSNMKLGNFAQAAKNYLESMYYYQKANNMHGKIGSMQALGELYINTGEVAKAYKLFFETNEMQEFVKGDRGQEQFVCQHLLNIGNIFFNIKDYDKALQLYDSARNIAVENNFESVVALADNNTGRAYLYKANYDTAYFYLQKSYNYYKKTGRQYSMAIVLNKLGAFFELTGDCASAIDHYQQALALNLEIGNKFGLARNHANLASCFKKLGKWALYKKELDQGLPYAQAIGVKEILLRYYKFFIEYCEQTGLHNKAHSYLNLYIPLAQETKEASISNLTALLIELHENDLANAKMMHDQQINLTELRLERDELRIWQLVLLISFVFLVLLSIAVLLINKVRTANRLERIVAERTKSLQDNDKKLTESNQTKDKFYSIIAHDLKSPFNSLIGFSNLLHDDYDDFSDEERKNFVEIIRNSSEEIFALLENLLDWTRKSSEKIKFNPVKIDLQQIVRQTIQLQEKNAGMKEIEVKNLIPKNTFVLADENMIRTVIRNLASNAIKFTNKNGAVIFEVLKKDGFVECTVQDTGIGMSEKQMETLFDLKTRVKKKGTANEKGTGLGLLLCKDFIERNAGELKIESKEGEGSKFIFTLPAR